MDRGVQIHTTDSKQWKLMPKDYLPGGLLSVVGSKYTLILQQKKVKVGRLGKWMAFLLAYKGKKLEIINLYWIPT